MTDYKHLTVPEELGKEIRGHDGRNDAERLYNWAEKQVKSDVKEILEEDLKSYVDDLVDRLEINQRTGELEMR